MSLVDLPVYGLPTNIISLPRFILTSPFYYCIENRGNIEGRTSALGISPVLNSIE
jgi:hypothetical protein